MEKAYKIAHAKLQDLKISTKNMCKKIPKIVQNQQKWPKLRERVGKGGEKLNN